MLPGEEDYYPICNMVEASPGCLEGAAGLRPLMYPIQPLCSNVVDRAQTVSQGVQTFATSPERPGHMCRNAHRQAGKAQSGAEVPITAASPINRPSRQDSYHEQVAHF
ncbi:hypothetical protein HAX54_007965 [Datura stramonium]|uniref:Uncharacterized protein n=1 Tax=Datura stramonium TaxID=4076 RepID=A0ABS8RV83_DATST|nr:hypothetical protein [Datura stramonium]